MKILVVDDEPFILEACQMILGGRGHDVSTARDGQEGVEVFCKYAKSSSADSSQAVFDVVLVDFRMPELDGMSTAKEIRIVAPGQRIILMSAFGTDEINRLAENLERIETLPKPFELAQLVVAVEKGSGIN